MPRYRMTPEVEAAFEAVRARRSSLKLPLEKPIWSPYPETNERPWSPQLRAINSTADVIGYGGAAGGGKALALDTPLPTPSGWTTMGDVCVGDYLFGEDGQPCRVVATSDVMVNHDCFDVVFDDGSVIRADADHRWFTTTDNERNKILMRTEEWRAARRAKRPSRSTGKRPDLIERNRDKPTKKKPEPPLGSVRTTKEIFDTLRVGKVGRTNHSVATCLPMVTHSAYLPIHPYVLGVWLGDGSKQGAKIYVDDLDHQTIREVESCGYPVHDIPSERFGWLVEGLARQLNSAGLKNNKHIPPKYLRGSIEQRIDLLKGLMDTDGYVAEDCGLEFCNTNKSIASGVLELLHSLGIKATMNEGRATLYGKDCGPKYRVLFTTNTIVFRLARKIARQKEESRKTQRNRYIVDVIPCESVPVKCVAVDNSSHLYLAGMSMIPTHNSDWLLGMASTKHYRSIIFRREAVQLEALIERSHELFDGHGDWRGEGSGGTWRNLPGGRSIKFAHLKNPGDWRKYQGHPHDLIGFDELPHFLIHQFENLSGWLRSERDIQCQVAAGFNPPTRAEERWVKEMFAPWVDRSHPNRAVPGEIRWFARVDNKRVERPDGEPFEHKGRMLTPLSWTFFPAKLKDNPIYSATGYETKLLNLPETLSRQLLDGDFDVEEEDDAWQIIPTRWIIDAMNRWKAAGGDNYDLRGFSPDVIAQDVAQGGDDKTVNALKYGHWIPKLDKHEGKETPDGPSAAKTVTRWYSGAARIYIDATGGHGGSSYDQLRYPSPHGYGLGDIVYPLNFSSGSDLRDRSGLLKMANLRAEMMYRTAMALDPDQPGGSSICLPDDPELLQDLAAARYEIRGETYKVESKEEIKKRIGRSPDCGDAVMMLFLPTPHRASNDTTATLGENKMRDWRRPGMRRAR